MPWVLPGVQLGNPLWSWVMGGGPDHPAGQEPDAGTATSVSGLGMDLDIGVSTDLGISVSMDLGGMQETAPSVSSMGVDLGVGMSMDVGSGMGITDTALSVSGMGMTLETARQSPA